MFKMLLALMFLTLGAPMWALPTTIMSPQPVGSTNFSFYGFPLYSAVLYTKNGTSYVPNEPFVLELNYKRNFSQKQFVDATLSEMKRIEGTLNDRAALQSKFNSCFRDVSSGDIFTAANNSPSQVDIYLNGTKTCRLKSTEISKRFFAIWLSENSRSPRLSRILRGQE